MSKANKRVINKSRPISQKAQVYYLDQITIFNHCNVALKTQPQFLVWYQLEWCYWVLVIKLASHRNSRNCETVFPVTKYTQQWLRWWFCCTTAVVPMVVLYCLLFRAWLMTSQLQSRDQFVSGNWVMRTLSEEKSPIITYPKYSRGSGCKEW